MSGRVRLKFGQNWEILLVDKEVERIFPVKFSAAKLLRSACVAIC